MLKLYDPVHPPNEPLEVKTYIPDLGAVRPLPWTAQSCTLCCFAATFYEVTNPGVKPPGRVLTLHVIRYQYNLTAVDRSKLTYPPGRTPLPTDPPFVVRAVDVKLWP
jgi:hypothetical protein